MSQDPAASQYLAQDVFEDVDALRDRPLLCWVIYDRPRDYPDCYVARKWLIERGKTEPTRTSDTMQHESLEFLRKVFESRRLVCLPRNVEDDPTIIEVWL